ncbi:uncharacterized protein [Drosophila suzukii]|uniref:Gag-like protein n=1 Tax=Drosophila suzukii TaxID=28584 RepID=A0ABM4TUQ3_DROSZ
MGPEPANLQGNRFAVLGESPKSKKKRPYQTLTEEFPELPTPVQKNPKFIIVKTKDSQKPISHYSGFAVHKALQTISKKIISISTLRDGNLLMLVTTKPVADKFLRTTHLPGLCDVEFNYHESLNFVKGTIYAPCLNNIPEEEIVKELRAQNVHSVFKFTKTIDNATKPSGVILVTFDLHNLPSKLDISWYSVKVREYIPNPMRCKNCQRIGHTARHCDDPTMCSTCNLAPHPPAPCSRTECANCSGQHPASSPACPAYQQQRDLLKIKTTKKCSMREARIIQKQQLQQSSSTINHSASFAKVASSQPTSVTASKPKQDSLQAEDNNKPSTSNKAQPM